MRAPLQAIKCDLCAFGIRRVACFHARSTFTGFAPADIMVASTKPKWNDPFEQMINRIEFRCHFDWAGYWESDERLVKMKKL